MFMNINVAIVGGGLTGMSAADVLSQNGCRCTLFERDAQVGGLAGSFLVNGVQVEKFYHHLFTSDTAMADLIARLGLGDKLEWLPTSNSFFANRIYRLSTPLDLLRFAHLGLVDRIRLGLLYLSTRFVGDWQPLEAITAREWLIRIAGQRVYEKVWQPLLRGKFGSYADEVAAVWMWNKLKLRGSSRGKAQEERLGYLREGFGQAIEAFERQLRAQGVQIEFDAAVERVHIQDGRADGVVVHGALRTFDRVLVTVAPELFLQIAPDLPQDYRARLSSIKYLANVCLVMSLDRSLSDTYWLNVADPAIPFTGVIEHTNMQRPETYGGAHLAYLSRYMAPEDPYYAMSPAELLDAYLPHLTKMFRGFDRAWVKDLWVWRERYTQPLIGLNYSQIKPPFQTPVENLWLSCMAQVYPQDRGMNYAVVYGQRVAQAMLGQDEQRAG